MNLSYPPKGTLFGTLFGTAAVRNGIWTESRPGGASFFPLLGTSCPLVDTSNSIHLLFIMLQLRSCFDYGFTAIIFTGNE